MRQIATTEPTRYEIAIRHTDGRAFLVAYSDIQTKRGLFSAMRFHGDEIIALTEMSETDEFTFGTKPRHHATLRGWWIGYTGRTQRDLRTGGELPFIAHEVVKAA